ncbi:MATE family efflux transporter [Cetobacterium sp. 2A]|uniref:MATE family efflux transporter n=1 Tax=Cetobacterium sp. 2A TaxID=2754723 RepID=UPI00163C9B22|nr:MATE family efflux transporter [Cetobacterium sp. 2A]MBC2856058.1 MATE family efflux transporter [Cetobacterium sp. 2A]
MRDDALKLEFENSRVLSTILKFSIPSSIGSIIGMLCVLTDRYFIGQVAGREGMSAIAIVFPYAMIMNSITFLFSGIAIIIGVKLGEDDKDGAEKILGTSFLWIILIGGALSVFLWLFNNKILLLLGATPENIVYAKQYTYYIIPIAVFQIFLGQSTLMRGIGYPVSAMGVNIFTAVVNIVLDYIFIMKFSMGILGASLATFIATAMSAIYIVVYFFYCPVIKLRFKHMRFDVEILKSVFKIGSPRFYNQLLQSALVVVTNKRAGIYGGDLATAAIGIISIIRNVINTSLQGFNQGTAAIISYNYGAKNYKRVKEVVKIQLWTVIVISSLLVFLMFKNSTEFSKFFVKNDIVLIDFTSNAMKINLCMMTFTAIFLSCNNFFQAIKSSKIATNFFVFRILVLNIPLVYILSYFFGEMGVWLAFPVSDTTVAIAIMCLTYKKLKKRTY